MSDNFLTDLDGKPTEIPHSWLQEKITLSPIEWFEERVAGLPEEWPATPPELRGDISCGLWAFASQAEEGDEIYTFSSDTDSWADGNGKAGYMLLRYGALISICVVRGSLS